MATTLKGQFLQTAKKAAEFATDSTIYSRNQLLIESDTLKMKMGDGVNTFAKLKYANLTPTEVQQLISDSSHTHINKTILDQINQDMVERMKQEAVTPTAKVNVTTDGVEIVMTDYEGTTRANVKSGKEINTSYDEANETIIIGGDGGFTDPNEKIKYITCWGDSLTAGGGWTNTLSNLAGMPIYNGGTGGENARTIVARQGADIMMVNNITIPADTTPVTIASRSTDSGISTELGYKVTPLLQGGAHVNPCKIGDIVGTLAWTGTNYADTNGTWTFTRKEAGKATTIDRPTAIRTDFDMNKNNPYLMIIYIGQNGGYTDLDDLVNQHKLMIQHASADHVIILGLSSGTAANRKDYENRMKKEFGRYFISLREYLAHPIYGGENGNTIVSCYGLADQNLEPGSKEYNGTTYNALEEIAIGTVPHQILQDSVHYTTGTKTVIGNMIYKKCKELNIF